MWLLSDNIKIDVHQRAKIERVQEMFIKGYLQHKQLDTQDGPASSNADFNRLLKLMLKMNILRSLDPDLVEELFFSKLIGSLQINNVIPHILSLGSEGPNDM